MRAGTWKRSALAIVAALMMVTGVHPHARSAAVGTVTRTVTAANQTVQMISIAWTSDSSGAVSGNLFTVAPGYLISAKFVPSASAAPTDAYDVTLVDTDGVDKLGGVGSDLSSTVASTHTLPLLRGIKNEIISTAAPAAGAESITTVPAGQYWRMVSWYGSITTSATVATRVPAFIIDDGTNVLYKAISGSAGVAASQTMAFPAAVLGASNATVANSFQAVTVLPDLILYPGWRFSTLTTSIQTGDQWGISRLVVDKARNAGNARVFIEGTQQLDLVVSGAGSVKSGTVVLLISGASAPLAPTHVSSIADVLQPAWRRAHPVR